ncbi:MAG: SIS domain-containing protein [Acidobacteriota bacterium]
MEEQELLQKNLKAEIFTAPVVADELERMWNTRRDAVRSIAAEIAAQRPTTALFFGSGGSAAALYTGYYCMLRYLTLPVSYFVSAELVASKARIMGAKAVAIGASYSGKTVDTMAAKRVLGERGVPLLAITRDARGELALGARWALNYDAPTLYSSPAYLTALLTVELGRALKEWSAELESFEEALHTLPGLLRSVAEPARELAQTLAPQLDHEKILVLSGGGSAALGHMIAYDIFGEYLKRYCAFINYGEFRHGPLEIIRPGEPAMMFLLTNDSSRPFGEATVAFARRHGARVVVFDSTELAPGAHPLLAPFVLYLSQLWLLYYLACSQKRDLSRYYYMHVVPYAEGDTFY